MSATEHLIGHMDGLLRSKTNDTASQAEIYGQLDAERKEIRVLEVQPGTGDEPLFCVLKRVSLLAEPKPEYETISYVWGDASLRGAIRTSGQVLDVPASSEVAIRRMRYPDRERALWIDAVCINQNDLAERAQQVSFVHEIYANGRRNLVWLGEDDHYTGRALVEIRKLLDEFRDETNDYRDAKSVLFDEKGRRKYSSTPLACDIMDWRALHRFYRNVWFSRLWVVQEVAFSPLNICFSGRFECRLEDALRAAICVRYKRFQTSRTTVDWTIYPTKIATFTDQICSDHVQLAQIRKASFLTIVRLLRQFEVSDPRDHMYGTIGLFQRYSGNREIPVQLLPDYTLPMAHVFRNATNLEVWRRGDVSVFCSIANWPSDVSSDWPSWVPYWRTDDMLNQHLSALGSPFNSANKLRQNLPLRDVQDKDVIALAGLLACTVLEVSSPMPYMISGISNRNDTKIRRFLQDSRTLAVDSRRDQSDAELTEIVATTLTRSQDGQKRRVNQKNCTERYEAFVTFLTEHPKRDYEDCYLSQNTTTPPTLANDFYMAMRNACSNRCVFSTDSGSLGIGPANMHPDDTVAVLYGMPAPLVLRPSRRHSKDATHELIGNCYVHGIMDGEAVLEHKAAGKEDEWFYLR